MGKIFDCGAEVGKVSDCGIEMGKIRKLKGIVLCITRAMQWNSLEKQQQPHLHNDISLTQSDLSVSTVHISVRNLVLWQWMSVL